ncbi:MAG: hypothetical protein JSW51_02890 [Gemmatimonadota bacterium]|nr:MAG: hypothetical protein JSW51_02890 [Gemmatimonadota bacterium]
MRIADLTIPVLGIITASACNIAGPRAEPLFIDGRAVAVSSDSVLAMTAPGVGGVVIIDQRTGERSLIGADELNSPAHVQWNDARIYVSDVDGGRPQVVVFAASGELLERIDLGPTAAVPHQFAVLPDGQIVFETTDDRLVALRGDSLDTFALNDSSRKTGALVAARGGVLHAVPPHTITLYNGLGRIRWRIDWPWSDSTYVADLAIDSRGRPLLLASEEGSEGFVVFAFDAVNGEITMWMEGPSATFSTRTYGDIRPDSASNWLGESP